MRSATEILRDEHDLILRALLSLETAAERLGAGGALPEGPWTGMIAWLRAFADRNHHAKEEKALFPAMIKAGVPAGGGSIAVMLEEHAEGRALLATMYTGAPVGGGGASLHPPAPRSHRQGELAPVPAGRLGARRARPGRGVPRVRQH